MSLGIGYFLTIIMGITLGLIGAGGSILTVPILVYLFHITPTLATSYSLLIVGITALLGAIIYLPKKQIDIIIALIFAFPSLVSILLTRTYIVPNLPASFLGINKDVWIMVLFSTLMMSAAFFMLKSEPKISSEPKKIKFLMVIPSSAVIGLLTGLIGAGGGFLIIPSLMILFSLPIKKAIGTSLLVIALNAFTGSFGDWLQDIQLDIYLLLSLLLCTGVGMFLGIFFNKYISGIYLKRIFAIFVLFISCFIFIEKLFL